MKMIIIDSIDKSAGIVRIEIDTGTFEIPLSILPADIKEGYELEITAHPPSDDRAERIRKLSSKLFKRDN